MPQATTPTQREIVDHCAILRNCNNQHWFMVQLGWVRDLKTKDGMTATEGFDWTDKLLKSK